MSFNNTTKSAYECRSDSFTHYLVPMVHDNPLGLAEDHYKLIIGGWKGVCDTAACQNFRVGCVLKTSGARPGIGARQTPDEDQYARWYDEGRDLWLPVGSR